MHDRRGLRGDFNQINGDARGTLHDEPILPGRERDRPAEFLVFERLNWHMTPIDRDADGLSAMRRLGALTLGGHHMESDAGNPFAARQSDDGQMRLFSEDRCLGHRRGKNEWELSVQDEGFECDDIVLWNGTHRGCYGRQIGKELR